MLQWICVLSLLIWVKGWSRCLLSWAVSLLVGFQSSNSIFDRYQWRRPTEQLWEVLHTQSMPLAEVCSTFLSALQRSRKHP